MVTTMLDRIFGAAGSAAAALPDAALESADHRRVDTPVLALGGRTPLEAVADQVGR